MTKPHFVPRRSASVPPHVVDMLLLQRPQHNGVWHLISWEGGPEDHHWIRSDAGQWWYSVVPWSPPLIEASSFGSVS